MLAARRVGMPRRLARRRAALARAQAKRFEAPARRGSLEPTHPALSDPEQNGQGLYSMADFCEWFQTAPEFDWTDCEVEGELPADLNGVFHQVGPGRFERGGRTFSHFLDGDGFISSWELSGGKARCRGRFVRTPEYAAEEEADEVLFRGAFGTSRAGGPLANALDIRSKNLANTNVVSWGGRMLALYEAGHPSRLDPSSLDLVERDGFDGALRPGLSASTGNDAVDQLLGMGGDAFTAHPKMDPSAGTFVGFSWTTRDDRPELTVLAFDEDFRRAREQEPDEPVRLAASDAQPHDFGLSENWCVFFENMLEMADLPSFLLGARGPVECLVARPQRPQKLHLAPRSKGLPNVCIDGVPGGFDVHVAHCHDGPPLWGCEAAEGRDPADLVTVYTSGWDSLPEGPFLGSWGEGDEPWPFELPEVAIAADFNYIPPVRLYCHVVDARRGELVDRRPVPGCERLCMEHPTAHHGLTGQRSCRFVYMAASNEVGVSSPTSGWARADLGGGGVRRWWAGSRCFTDEPRLVPRGGDAAGTWSPGVAQGAEDDCWMLGVMGDVARGRSCLCVLDASRVEDGPVCKIWLPHLLPHGLHGSFVSAVKQAPRSVDAAQAREPHREAQGARTRWASANTGR